MSRPTRPFEVVEGDTTPHFIITCEATNEAGERVVQDITGWTFTLYLQRPAPSTVLVKSGTILNPLEGQVAFLWNAGDFKEGRAQRAYITMVDGSGETRSFGEFLFNVSKKPTP